MRITYCATWVQVTAACHPGTSTPGFPPGRRRPISNSTLTKRLVMATYAVDLGDDIDEAGENRPRPGRHRAREIALVAGAEKSRMV